ncbi:LPS chain length-determining protein [Vibrio splendidus]|uniref:LPS O-antigen chain length determinant protein WzzB n=1 Tax=Vibrio splendidus TaxID=29497 RepID=UPI000D333F64|nr:Wzz/FepE/Etk N-terminal domain-containing protein [Vibrio splendidus]PTO86880.1 LPS chain length-determining protein [Vibrio splendidus]PTP47519.1 LPS chain length-determining protein [Vibrio splendidus]
MFERLTVKEQIHSPLDQPIYNPNDEIDIREIFKALWNGKVLIVAIAALFAIGSLTYVLLAQDWWSSNAKISKAQPQDIAAYQQQVKQYQPIFNTYQEDGTVLVSNELDNLVQSKVLFQRFLDTFRSSDNKRTFLDNSVDFIDIRANSDESDESVGRLYAKWFDKISVSLANQDLGSPSYVISFQAMTKSSSYQFLSSYISATEEKVHQDAFNNLQAVVNGKRNELIQQKKVLESQARNELLVEMERVKYAVAIANAAGVSEPIQTSNHDEIFGIDLGAKGLKAKVEALKSIKNLSVIEPRLRQIDAKLEMLNNFEIDRNVEFQTFRFLENVEQPIFRDGLKRALIIFLGALFGGGIGVIIVLVRFTFKKED